MQNKADLLSQLCELLISDQRSEAISFAQEFLPFKTETNIGIKEYEKLVTILPATINYEFENARKEDSQGSRRYSKHTILEVYRRDGFIDRFTGIKLVHPGLLFLLNFELPEIFKYHGGWKLGECHIAFWELFPTVDHIIPISRGGSDEVENLLTISMVGNTRKRNVLLGALRWMIHPPGNLNKWDGLTAAFLKLMEKNNDYVDYKHIPNWPIQFQKLKEWKRVTLKLQELNPNIKSSQASVTNTPSSGNVNKEFNPIENKVKRSPDTKKNISDKAAITFEDLPVNALFSYGNAKTIYRKLPPIGNSLGRVVNLCRPQSDLQREWGLSKESELQRIVRPIQETPEIQANLFL